MAIEIVDLPSYKMVDLSIVFCMFRWYITAEFTADLHHQSSAVGRGQLANHLGEFSGFLLVKQCETM